MKDGLRAIEYPGLWLLFQKGLSFANFANSKIVYLSGGTVLIESLFYNLKRFALSIAKNQIKNCLAWEKKGFINYLGDISKKKFNQKQVENKINSYSQKKNKVLNKKLIFGKDLIYKSILRKF